MYAVIESGGKQHRVVEGEVLKLEKIEVSTGDTVEFATGVAKFMQPFAKEICEATGAKAGDAIFFMPGPVKDVYKFLGYMRDRLAEIMDLIPKNQWNLLWVTEFPLVEWDDDDEFYEDDE